MYNLTYLNGKKIRISLESPVQIGENTSIRVLGKTVLIRCTGEDILVELSDSITKPLLELIGIILAILAALYYLSTISPDVTDSVLRAAKTIDSSPVISKGRVEMLRCGKGDLYSFDVSNQSGEHLGYVCTGNAFNNKGATARFD